MIRGHNIICISSIDWDFVWQGHQEVMATFAGQGNRVLYIENTGVRTPTFKDFSRIKRRFLNWKKGVGGVRKERDNLFIYSPLMLPFPYSSVVKFINRFLFVNTVKRWMAAADFANPIIWTFLPTNVAVDLIDSIDTKKLVVYYCIAEFTQLVRSSKKVEKSERELLKRCDLVFAQGEKIRERCLRYNKNVHIFPFGVNPAVFEVKEGLQTYPPVTLPPGKRLGYIGGIHRHVDIDLLRYVDDYITEKRLNWNLVLIGPLQIDKHLFKGMRHVDYERGKKELNELPFWINHFDVCLIPYELNEYTKTVYPTKLNEYLMMGKPVVSTSIPEIDRFDREHPDIIKVAHSREHFIQRIEETLRQSTDADEPKRREARRDVARQSDWPSRIEKMTGHMKEAMERRHSEKALRWRDDLIQFYRGTRRRALKVALSLLVLYVIAFKTPVLWFLASPLKVAEAPVKAGAIVVFAGGVGESGRPAQGYEERVEKAVRLYKEGYAPDIIFSTGFRYTFEEADVMKALAVSLGIPPDAVMLEKRARSTYENVAFTGRLLEAKKIERILLVSSPYHMRRAMLTFKKLYPDIEVIPTPIEKSIYYAKEGDVRLRQYRGILHEYLGILYYLFKGYSTV